MMKRSGKWYRTNEAEVMRSLGLEPTPNSGSEWIVKEDGQSDKVICQLKSTDAQSIKVSNEDIQTLEYNATVSHKIPVFAIQFIATSEVYLLVKPEVLQDLAKYIKTGEYNSSLFEIEQNKFEDMPLANTNQIKSSLKSRKYFEKENENKFKKQKRSAK